MSRPRLSPRLSCCSACLVTLLLVAANSELDAHDDPSMKSDGIHMAADADDTFEYRDDFSALQFLTDAFPDNLTADQWQPGQITNSGPFVRSLTYRFHAERSIQQLDVQVSQRANAQLGGVNVLYVSFNGLDWLPAATSGTQQASAAGWQEDPLTISAEQRATFQGHNEVWIRLVLSNGSGLKTNVSNIISLVHVTTVLGDESVRSSPQVELRSEWDRLQRAPQATTVSLDASDPPNLRSPHYYEDSDGFLREPTDSCDLRPQEPQAFWIQRQYMGWQVPPKDLNPPRRPTPARYPLSLALFVNVKDPGRSMLAEVTVRCTRDSSRHIHVLWDGQSVDEFDAGSYFEEERSFLIRLPTEIPAGIHELRVAGRDSGAIHVRRIRLVGADLEWAKKPLLPDKGTLKILSAYYMPDPEPPRDSQAVEGRSGSNSTGLVFHGLQKLYTEHADFGGMRVVLHNPGTDPVRIRELLLGGQPVEESYVDFVHDDWDARGVVWYRIRPATILPGKCGQVYLRFRRRTAGDYAALTINLENGTALRVNVPYQPPDLTIDYVTPCKSGAELYVYLRRSGTANFREGVSVSLDGVPLREARVYGANFPGNVALVVAKLPRVLSTGEYPVVGVTTGVGPVVAAQFRVLPHVFTRSSIGMPPEMCQEMHMNHAMWHQVPLETCEQYGITTTCCQSANGASPLDTHRRVAFVMAPDEADAYDNVGGGYDKGLGYNARLMTHAGWSELVDRFAPQAVTWFNIDGTTRPLNWAVYGQFADISSFDPYPVTFYAADQAFVRESLAMVRKCSTPNRLFACLETFGWPQPSEPRFAEGISGYGRGPIPAEYRQNVIQAIGAGIKGLTNWTYPSGVSGWQLNASIKEEIAGMNRLIEQIEDELLLGTPIDLATCDGGVVDTGVVGEEKWPKDRVWVSSLLCGPDAIVLAAVNHIPANKPQPPQIEPARNVTITVTLPDFLSQVQAYEVTESGMTPVVTTTENGKLRLTLESLESGRLFALRRHANVSTSIRFSYEQAKDRAAASDSPTRTGRVNDQSLPHTTGHVYVYASFDPLNANPSELVDAEAQESQSVAIGQTVLDSFTPGVSFGVVKDTHVGLGNRSFLLPWVTNGQFDYYGMYARPHTPYDFKLKLDTDRKQMTVWVSGRGDDDWFLLAEGVALEHPIDAIDCVRVEQNMAAPGVELTVRSSPWPEGERVRPHPASPTGPKVVDGNGFRFQSMRSLANMPGRHVIIARNNPKTVPHESAWLGFPDVVQYEPMKLACSFTAGRAHGGGGPILVSRSEDLGKSWSQPIVVHPSGVNCSRIQQLHDGSLLVLADVSVGGTYCVVFYRSTDGGQSWENISYLDPPKIGGRGACVPSRMTEMPDGSWLVVGSWCTGNPFELSEGERLEIYRSTDRGKTWALHSIVQEYPRSLSEASIVPAEGGRLWMFAREACRILPGVKTYSDDGGKTWSRCEELPFPIVGRTCAAMLKDGRVLLTTRHGAGRAGLWAWVGRPEEETKAGLIAAHFNDAHSVGMRDGELHIENDGLRGQFTQYYLRVPDSPESSIDVTAEVKVLSNDGYAATLGVPYVGKLRILADQVEMAHDPTLIAKIEPGVFHIYRVVAQGRQMTLYIDGKEALVADKSDTRTVRSDWTPLKLSPYLLAFGNEPTNLATFDYTPGRGDATVAAWEHGYQRGIAELQQLQAIPPISMLGTTVAREQITPRVSGHSIWRRVETKFEDPKTGIREQSWLGNRDGFPDQYMLDRVLEVDASIGGGDQGYSGWAVLGDDRIFVVNYTDDTAPACPATPNWPMGLPWIRGTYVQPADLSMTSPILEDQRSTGAMQ